VDKWVPMSPRRIAEIKVTSSDLEVYLVGAAAESVNFFYAINGNIGNTTCILSEDGRAVLFVSAGKCEVY